MRCRFDWALGTWRYVLLERCVFTGAVRPWRSHEPWTLPDDPSRLLPGVANDAA